jgi:hypothetical protein
LVTTVPTSTASVDPSPSVPLLPHQAARFSRLYGCTRELLLWQAGLGKTAMFLAYISTMLDRGTAPRVLVVVPGKALHAQWAAEQRHLAPWLSMHYIYEHGGYPCPATDVRDFDVEVTTPQLLSNYLPGYLAKQFDAVVVDELGEFRSGGKRWEALRDVCDSATHVWAGTATIVQNHPQEVWHCLRAVAGPDFMPLGEFDAQYTTFTEAKVNPFTKRFEPSRPNGCKDPAGLGRLIADYADVLIVGDTDLDLPEVERVSHWVQVGPRQATNYQQTRNLKTRERIAGFDGSQSAVTEVLLPLLDERTGQAVVYCQHVDLVGYVAAACR